MKTVKSKADGIVKEDLVLKLAPVFLTHPPDPSLHWLDPCMPLGRLSKVWDFLIFPQHWLPTTVWTATNFCGWELLAHQLFQESELTISPRVNINSWQNSISTVSSQFQYSPSASKSTLTLLNTSLRLILLKLKSRLLILQCWPSTITKKPFQKMILTQPKLKSATKS